MKILELNDLNNFQFNSVVTLGFFDGLHLGHQKIIKILVDESKKLNYKSIVITFSDDVLALFKMTSQIMSTNNKLQCLKQLGVDYVLLLKSSDNFMNLNAFEFIDNYLEKLNTKIIVCGSDFSFAKHKEGNIEFIKNNTNYKVIKVDDKYYNNIKISSSYIRELLLKGEITLANKLSYNDFNVVCKVINGKQIGRQIGFKTANLLVDDSIKLLAKGVYFGKVFYNDKYYKAMINVGYNPTINDECNLKVEAHILSFNEDIYDKEIKVIFNVFHRKEIKFSSLQQLKDQLEKDANELKKMN